MKKEIDRRQFLRRGAVTATSVIGFPYFVRCSALGKASRVAPSDWITVGCIGVGGRGTANMRAFMGRNQVRGVAVCDPDANRRSKACHLVNQKYGNQDCAAYSDFRQLVACQDIDAVSICTPDHWHIIPAIEAAKSGKDVFCEKPLSLTIAEARATVDAVRRYERVFQTGIQQRSSWEFRFACELVRNRYIGELETVTANVGGPPQPFCNLPANADCSVPACKNAIGGYYRIRKLVKVEFSKRRIA